MHATKRRWQSSSLVELSKYEQHEGIPMLTVISDGELEYRVTNFLAKRFLPGLRSLSVKARDGVVTISGRVSTFYEQQVCNQCCRCVAGVRELINAVDVGITMPVLAGGSRQEA
jgi:osmotically-inducible protein OsmY